MRARWPVGVDNDALAGLAGGRVVDGAAAAPAGADDDEMVVGADMLARLLQRREGGDAGTGIGRRQPLRDAVIGQEVAAVRYDDVRAVAAGGPRAQGAGPEA